MGLLDWLLGRNKDESEAVQHISIAPPAPVAAPGRSPEALPPSYGIESAIQLMRTLPIDDDPDLVLRVVRKTLRSTGVSVEQIVLSAQSREKVLSVSIDEDRAALALLERELAELQAKIEQTGAQLVETRSVRERLEDAIENETKIGLDIEPNDLARVRALARAALRS